MLEYRRYKGCRRGSLERSRLSRRTCTAPRRCRSSCGGCRSRPPRQAYDPDRLGVALGDLLTPPPQVDTSHIRPTVSLELRLEVLRDMLGRSGRLDFDKAFGDEDRLTQAVTIFALLEMHKKGEATWSQSENFGAIEISSSGSSRLNRQERSEESA